MNNNVPDPYRRNLPDGYFPARPVTTTYHPGSFTRASQGGAALRIVFLIVLLIPLLVIAGFYYVSYRQQSLANQFTYGQTLFTYSGQTKAGIYSLAWSPDSQRIASGSSDVQIWNALSGAQVQTLKANTQGASINALAWSPDGTQIVAGSTQIDLWNVNTTKLIRTYTTQAQHKTPRGTLLVNALAWSPQKTAIAVAYTYMASGANGHKTSVYAIDIWNPATGKTLHSLRGDTRDITAIAWSPDGKSIASVSSDRTIRVWDGQTGKHLTTATTNQSLKAIAWSPDGKSIASAGTSIQVWQAGKNKPQITITPPDNTSIAQLAWSPDNKYLASAGSNASIWDASTGQHMLNYEQHHSPLRAIAWSPNGQYIVSGDAITKSKTPGPGQANVWYAQP